MEPKRGVSIQQDLFHPFDSGFDEKELPLSERSDENDYFHRAYSLAVVESLLQDGIDARHRPFNLLDRRTLALQAIAFSLGSLGLGSVSEGGVQRETMADHLCKHIEEQLTCHDEGFTLPHFDEIKSFAKRFVDQLVNSYTAKPFEASIFNPATKTFRKVEIRIFEEVDDIDNNFYLRPSVSATNLYLGALDLSLEDAQYALQFLLEHQIKKGMLNNAFKTSKELRTKTLAYKDHILRFERQISTNVRNVGWRTQIGPKLDEIKKNVPQLLETNRTILKGIQSRHELREGDRGELITALTRAIKDCISVHKALSNIVIGLDGHYRKEQDRQGFFSRATNRLPNLMDEVLGPLMSVPGESLTEVTETLISQISPPSANPIFDIKTVMMEALRPRRVYESAECDHQELDLEVSTIHYPPNVSEADIIAAKHLINSKISSGARSLSNIVHQATDDRCDFSVIHAAVLVVLSVWQKDTTDQMWEPFMANNKFTAGEITSSDFHINPITKRSVV